MLAREALEVLGVAASATPAEIKAAHRDLVKVWHPDRFGSDARLRFRAEEKLKQINQAYMALRSNPAVGDPVASDVPTPKTATAVQVAPDRSRTFASAGIWVARSLGILLLVVIGFVAVRAARREGDPVPPDPPVAAKTVDAPAVAAAGAVSGQLKRAGAAPFRVKALSEAQTEQMNEACAAQRLDAAAHQRCVEAQLDLMTNASSAPDLSTLDGAERESIASACSGARRTGGGSGYNSCLNQQMAEFAANPARPDMAALSEADRSQIEAACRNAKQIRGPAAYNRCRIRLVQLLGRAQ